MIGKLERIIENANYIKETPLGLMWFRGAATELNEQEISPEHLAFEEGLEGGLFVRELSSKSVYEVSPEYTLTVALDGAYGYPAVGDPAHYIASERVNGMYKYSGIQNGEECWSRLFPYRRIVKIGNCGLLWENRDNRTLCELISLSTGEHLWGMDHPQSYVDLVLPYEDKVIIQWEHNMGSGQSNRVACIEVLSGKILWEAAVSGYYQKYGEDKLVSFWGHHWRENITEENHQYAEIDIRTGEVYTRTYPGYNHNVFVFTVYKDYLIYATRDYARGLGIIDLKTREIIQEFEFSVPPASLNYLKALVVYNGELYVEVQAEVEHSDIYVFELAE